MRVLRGPDWDKGEEDGGEGHVGTVTEILMNNMVRVVWDNGKESICRSGAGGKFDLRIFDSAPVGKYYRLISFTTGSFIFRGSWISVNLGKV